MVESRPSHRLPRNSVHHQNTSKAPGRRAKPRRRSSLPLLALNLAIVLVLAGGTAAYGALSHTVTLTVEGESTTVRSFGGTVADVLDAHGVDVRAGDRLSMAATESVSDGDTIDVAYAKPVTLTVDGAVSQQVVFDDTVEEALDSLGVATPTGAFVSAKDSAAVPRSGMELVVSTPKTVTVVADGEKKIKPGTAAFVAPGDKLRVVRIEKVAKTETVKVEHAVEVQEDPEALMGETEVVKEGKNGKNLEQVTLVYADGKLRERIVVASDPVSRPVTEVVSRGTSRTSPDSVWDKIAKCESGGNWKINTGNGYYGGLQFSAATWKSVGGPGLPHENSREVQIKYAKILQARSGWGQWGCAGARFN
jgi:uncharacterized protein YabE (DUF348 family)